MSLVPDALEITMIMFGINILDILPKLIKRIKHTQSIVDVYNQL